MSTDERHEWLFLSPADCEADVDRTRLDPGDEDERRAAILAEHPEFAPALEDGLDEIELGGGAVNPKLHVTVHEVVATRIWENNPAETLATANRLRALGYSRHEALHMVMSVVSDELYDALQGQAADDHSTRRRLAALPRGWPAPDGRGGPH